LPLANVISIFSHVLGLRSIKKSARNSSTAYSGTGKGAGCSAECEVSNGHFEMSLGERLFGDDQSLLRLQQVKLRRISCFVLSANELKSFERH
jgi:hypothetical protein